MSNILRPLNLVALDANGLRGIYGASGTVFPRRMSYLHPVAAERLTDCLSYVGGVLVFSDMWRSSTASLARRYPKGRLPRRGVQPPAYSAHNFGFAVDIAVDRTLANLGMDKKQLDELMSSFGWWCHRLDHKRGSEDWHYNYLGQRNPLRDGERRTSAAVERLIYYMYGPAWERLGPHGVQLALRVCGLYDGDIDGKIGPHTKAAVKAFQRSWRPLKSDGVPGPKTCRVLWFRAAELTAPALEELWRRKG